jgi:hypothetical protein
MGKYRAVLLVVLLSNALLLNKSSLSADALDETSK